MRILSLFDGISCGRIALERNGIEVDKYYASEIDKYAIQVTQKNYPNTIQVGDVAKLSYENGILETEYTMQDVGRIDLVIGGSPCQSLSIVQSQTRQNLDGKSKLFYEYIRVLEETKPRYFLFENVASMNNESKQVISSLLGVEPIFINSNCFVAQDRPRLYWTNIPVDMDGLQETSLCLNDILEKQVDEKYFYSCEYDFHGLDKSVCATLHMKGHDILKRVNSPYFKSHTLTTCGGGNTQKKVMDNGRPRKLTPLEYERLQGLPDNYTAAVSNTARYTAIGNGWTVDVIAHILSFIPKED